MKNKIIWCVVIIIVIVLAVVLSRNKNNKDHILISANLPLSGDLAVYGEYIKQGAEMGYGELKGKYPNVSPIIFDWQDNQGKTADTVTIFNKQKTERPDIYMSALKPQTAAIIQMVTDAKIPHITWILDVLINKDSNNNIRNWVNFKTEAEVFVNYLKTKDTKKVYLVYPNIDSAVVEYENIVRPGLVKLGLKNENIITEAYNLSRDDFSDIALKIKQFNPDHIIINGFIPHLVAMVKDFSSIGVIKDGNTIASLDMLDTARLLSKQQVEGIVVAAPKYLVEKGNKDLEDWKNRFFQKYKRKPTYHDAYAYDTVKVILEAASKIDFPASSKEWIESLRKVKTTGITGDIRFDDDGSSVTTMYPAVYRNGDLIPIK